MKIQSKNNDSYKKIENLQNILLLIDDEKSLDLSGLLFPIDLILLKLTDILL